MDKNLINVRVNGVPNVFSMTNNLQVESSKRMSMVQAAAQSRHLQQIGLGRDFSKYGAVLAVYFVATGSPEYNPVAHQALTYAVYAINDDATAFAAPAVGIRARSA